MKRLRDSRNTTRTLSNCIFVSLLTIGVWAPAYANDGQAEADATFRVVLLGTGTPVPNDRQFGPSILVEAGGRPYVVDCGRGCGIRLGQYYGARDYRKVDTILLSHFHSDHIVGLPEVYLNGWLQQRQKPLRLIGPSGVTRMAEGLQGAFARDIKLRTFEAGVFGIPIEGGDIATIALAGDGLVLEEFGLRITAFLVDHGHVKPAYGFRFDYGGRSVVISGDTGPSQNLLEHAKGADVVIHEVMSPGLIEKIRTLYSGPSSKFIVDIHTTPKQAGEIFQRISPKLAVYYHTSNDAETRDELVAETRKTYDGPLLVGEDLLVIDIGDEVTWRINNATGS